MLRLRLTSVKHQRKDRPVNKLIPALIALVILAIAGTASAERTFRTYEKVTRLVVKDFRKETNPETDVFTFSRPATILHKTCVDAPKYDCVYEVKGDKERFLKRVKSDWIGITYVYEAKIEIAKQ